MQDSNREAKNACGLRKPVFKTRQFSVMYNLRNREVFGVCCKRFPRRYVYSAIPHIRDNGSASFVVPSLLSVHLSSLVNYDALYLDGHVFLGFSSCGQFVLSYTNDAELGGSGLASLTYVLHWWLFNGRRSLKLVGSSRLFSTQEGSYPTSICYAEWPNLKSQIVVFGWGEESDICNVTIVSVPNLHTCMQCKSCENMLSANNANCRNARCLNQGFSAHFEQMPFNGALQLSSLKIDGMLVLNLSHSIAVISAGLANEYTDRRKLGQALQEVESLKKESKNSEKLIFTEKFYGENLNGSITGEEAEETECHECFMQVKNQVGEVLLPVSQGHGSCQAFSQHLVLDMEHVIFDVLKKEYYDAYKYGSVLTYEMNITEVFPENLTILVHNDVLLFMPDSSQNPMPTNPNHLDGKISHHAEFYLLWHLKTGRYDTVLVAPLKCCENENWSGQQIKEHDRLMRRNCAVPSNVHRSVYYLNNAAVLRGKSLEVLWNSDKTFAIRL